MTDVLQRTKLEEGVSALFTILAKDQESQNKKNLLDFIEPVFLQIDVVKIPKIKRRIVRIPLKHSLVTPTSDVCLIVADVIRGRRVNHVVTENHYKKILKKRGVTDVQNLDIVPSRRIRVEFDQFEAKRKLCDMYDFFLIDEKISNYLRPKLGSVFSRARKWPIPVRMKRKNLKDEILSKLKKSSLALDGSGTTKVIQIGRVDMSQNEITDNILSVANYIAEKFPGGWKNIRSLHLKGTKSCALPVYVSCISQNEVPNPVEKRKRRKKRFTGEVATIGEKVTVYPSGKVKIHSKKKKKCNAPKQTKSDEGSDDIEMESD